MYVSCSFRMGFETVCIIEYLKDWSTHFSSMNISTAFSLAALRTPVMVPPALPAAYARSIDGYFTLSGFLNVKSTLNHHHNSKSVLLFLQGKWKVDFRQLLVIGSL